MHISTTLKLENEDMWACICGNDGEDSIDTDVDADVGVGAGAGADKGNGVGDNAGRG